MADFRVKMKFRSQQWGWTETYYWNGDDPTGRNVYIATKTAVISRRSVLATNIELASVTITNLAVGGSSSVYYREISSGEGFAPGGGCTKPWIAILVDGRSFNELFRRQFLFRGWPDIFTAWSGFDPLTTTRPVPFLNLYRGLRAGFGGVSPGETTLATGWSLYGRTTGADFERPTRWKITAVARADDCGGLAVAVPTAAGYGQYMTVHVSGLTDCVMKGYNGDHQITGSGAAPPLPAPPAGSTWWMLSKRLCCQGDIQYNGRGSIYRVTKGLIPLVYWTLGGVVVRDTGLPAHTTRGRSRKRNCCS